MSKDYIAEATTIEEVIGLAVGGGSVCWDDMSGTGVFHDREASEIVDRAVARIKELTA